MLGRATRLCPEIHKTHFEIYDPVGTYDSLESVNSMKPIVVNNAANFEELVNGVAVETEENIEELAKQIIGKLQRRKNSMSDKDKAQFKDLTGGKDITEVIADIKEAITSAKKSEKAYSIELPSAVMGFVTDSSLPVAAEASALSSKSSIKNTIAELKKALLFLDTVTLTNGKSHYVIIDDREDKVTSTSRGFGNNNKAPGDYLQEFTDYVKTNPNNVVALSIVCTKPNELTREALKSLKLTLDREGFTEQQLNTAIGIQTNEEMAADIITLIRRYALGSTLLSHEERIKRAVARLKANNHFSKIEEKWIDRIESYLIHESVLNENVFKEEERFKGKIQKQFKHDLGAMVKELNTYLYEDMKGVI